MTERRVRLTLKRIGVLSAARFGCAWAILSLIEGSFCSLTAFAVLIRYGIARLPINDPGQLFNLLAIVPVVILIGGLFAGLNVALWTLFFNVVSRMMGGIEFNFQAENQKRPEVEKSQPGQNTEKLTLWIKKRRQFEREKLSHRNP